MNDKIVVLGSCSVDFTTYAPRLPKPGETLHGSKFTTSYGGKGANQCVAAAKLGGNVFMICKVVIPQKSKEMIGNDLWGKQYKEYLKEVGVDVTHVDIADNVATGIAQISVAENGENQIVIVTGANNHLSVEDVQKANEVIREADVLIGQLETPFETTLEAFKLNTGIKLLNAAPARANIEKILPYCTILCVNELEASMLTNMEVSLKNAPIALSNLLGTGCKIIIITLGKNGAVYSTKDGEKPIHVHCESVTAVDTTGAGDAFVGALATFLVKHRGLPLHQIIGAACQVASSSVTKEGTQTSYPTNIKVFENEYKYTKL